LSGVRFTVLLFAIGGCASSQHEVISIRGLTCTDCAGELEERATQTPGVRGAHFDAKKVELNLELAAGTSAESVATAIAKEPVDGRAIEALPGAGHGAFAEFAPFEPGWDAKVLSRAGEDVGTFEPATGRVTLVDFSADWCGPCHALDEQIHAMLKASPATLAYRRLNIVDWESPVAKHWLTGASELPYVIVLDVRGHEVARLAGLKPDELKAAIEKGSR
jgi:thiol-disulfide isomerase/thioredoxin